MMTTDQNDIEDIMQRLSFEVETVSKDNLLVSNTKNIKPLNVKIKVRKKKDLEREQNAVVSFAKMGRPVIERIKLVSSAQTILSFNMFMEAEDIEIINLKKEKRPFFRFFRSGGSLDDPKILKTTKTLSKSENELTEILRSKLEQSYDSQTRPEYHGVLGKCKPGGCLDPPFDEDREPYMTTNENQNQSLRIMDPEEIPENQVLSSVSSQQSELVNQSKLLTKRKLRGSYGSNSLSLQEKPDQQNDDKKSVESAYSSTVMTYPPAVTLSEMRIYNEMTEKKPRTSSSSDDKSQISSTYYSPNKEMRNRRSSAISNEFPPIDKNALRIGSDMSVQEKKSDLKPLTDLDTKSTRYQAINTELILKSDSGKSSELNLNNIDQLPDAVISHRLTNISDKKPNSECCLHSENHSLDGDEYLCSDELHGMNHYDAYNKITDKKHFSPSLNIQQHENEDELKKEQVETTFSNRNSNDNSLIIRTRRVGSLNSTNKRTESNVEIIVDHIKNRKRSSTGIPYTTINTFSKNYENTSETQIQKLNNNYEQDQSNSDQIRNTLKRTSDISMTQSQSLSAQHMKQTIDSKSYTISKQDTDSSLDKINVSKYSEQPIANGNLRAIENERHDNFTGSYRNEDGEMIQRLAETELNQPNDLERMSCVSGSNQLAADERYLPTKSDSTAFTDKNSPGFHDNISEKIIKSVKYPKDIQSLDDVQKSKTILKITTSFSKTSEDKFINRDKTNDSQYETNKNQYSTKRSDLSNIQQKTTDDSDGDILLDFSFQTVINENNNKVIKTLDSAQHNESKDIRIIKSKITARTPEINVPINTTHNMIITILERSQTGHRKKVNIYCEDNVPGNNDEVALEPSASESQFTYDRQSHLELMAVCEENFHSFYDIIKSLKTEIDTLAAQQETLRKKLGDVNKTKPFRVSHANRKCSCFRK